MSTKTTDKAARTISEMIDTARDDVKLRISTHHRKDSREIVTRVSRVQITEAGGVRETVALGRGDGFPEGLTRRSAFTIPRYSLAALENAHDDFISRYVAGTEQITALKAWAERH